MNEMRPGWVDEVAKQVSEERKGPPPFKRRTMRQSQAHDYQCGMTGWRKGLLAQKLDRVLGPVDEEVEG